LRGIHFRAAARGDPDDRPMTAWSDRLVTVLRQRRIGVVLDVGAHTGEYAGELFDSGFTGAIYSFEPQPHAWESLKRHAKAETRGRWQVAERAAVGDRDGEVTFYEAGNSFSSSVLPMAEAHVEAAPQSAITREFSVPMKRLDQIVPAILKAEKADRAFLKIDVQGAEHLVLAGASRALAKSIRGVQLEMSLVELYEGQWPALKLHEFLAGRGFVVWDMIEVFRHPRTLQLLQYDGVYMRPRRTRA
jgi:FkbM family methyltransferase